MSCQSNERKTFTWACLSRIWVKERHSPGRVYQGFGWKKDTDLGVFIKDLGEKGSLLPVCGNLFQSGLSWLCASVLLQNVITNHSLSVWAEHFSGEVQTFSLRITYVTHKYSLCRPKLDMTTVKEDIFVGEIFPVQNILCGI